MPDIPYGRDYPDPWADTLLGDLITAAELDAMQFAPLVEHVPYLVVEGFGVLAGAPKAGKSWLAVGIALACAQGGIALGGIDVAARHVLLLALEDGHRRLQARMRRLNYGQSLPAWLDIITTVAPGAIVATITEWVQRHGDDARPPLVILDTLGRARPQRQPGDDPYIADYQLGARIKATVDEVPGAALVAIHHTRKMAAEDWLDTVSGTQGIAGSADYVLVLTRKRKSSEGVIAVTGRDIAENEYAVKTDEGIWTLDGMDILDAAATVTTRAEAAAAFRPDIYAFSPRDAVPDALILQLSTLAGNVEGDEPSVHVGYVDDATAVFKAEGADLDESEPGLNEVVVHTAKLTQLVRLSREQYYQVETADQLSLSVNRAIVRRSDIAFLAEPAPVGPAVAPMPGLLNVTNVVEGGEVSTNLDVISDLIAQLEDNLSVPTAIVVDPLGWSEIRKLKIGTDWNATLLGAGTSDAQQMLFGLPVYVNRGMTDYSGVVVDRSAIVTAAGSVMIATSEHAYFGSDGVGLRATWRFGHVVVRPERIGKFTIVQPGS